MFCKAPWNSLVVHMDGSLLPDPVYKNSNPTKNLEPRVLTSMIINSLHEETETYRYENKDGHYKLTNSGYAFPTHIKGLERNINLPIIEENQ